MAARQFRMPDVGEGLTEAEILKWHVRPGDTVTDGQVVVEVETAKAAVELPIPFDGEVRELHVPEGATVDVGTPIITVDTAGPPAGGEGGEGAGGEREPVLVGYGVNNGTPKRRARRRPGPPTEAATEATEATEAPETAPEAALEEPEAPAAAPVAAVPVAVPVAVERPLAKPPVRKLAKDLGIDLRTVTPTGPEGTVTRADVHAAAEAAAPPRPVARRPAGGERRVPIRGVRKVTAQAVTASAFTAPHVTEFVTVDVTRTVRLVELLKREPDLAGLRVSPLLLVARALLVAVRRHPEINASWDENSQEIVYKDAINLGIAAATPRGLIVPNIKDAGAMSLPDLARALGELVTAAREGKTTPAAMAGGTVTITNIGVFGIDTGTPILNSGESAILAFGAIRQQPWVVKGKVKPRHATTLALSFDHRLVDGELGSKVLADVAAVLEDPRRLIVWS